MKVQQIYEITNNITKEILGDEVVLNEDLSNLVDVGDAIFGATDVDNYVNKLVNHIGKVIFVNRKYSGSAPSVYMDAWEFGSVLQKIKAEMPEATENESWKLEAGKSYDPNVFYQPEVSAKFFNSKTTFEVDMSFTEAQVKESFSSATQLNGFLSMLSNEVDKALTIRYDALVMRTINNMTAMTMLDAFPEGPVAGSSSIRAVNLLKLYQDTHDETLTNPKDALSNPEFIRFASMQMRLHVDRLSSASKLYNIGGNVRFTPKDLLHVVTLSEFESAATIYLQSDTYHKELVSLPKSETVPFWQGSGTDYAFESTSKINVTIAGGGTLEADGILAVMFDRDALGVTNVEHRVTTHYNPKAEFFTNFYKSEAGYFNDADENFIVFYVK